MFFMTTLEEMSAEEHVSLFVDRKKRLEGLESIGQGYRESPERAVQYRAKVAEEANRVSGGTVILGDDVPDSVVDKAYLSLLHAEKETVNGYFEDNRERIVNGIEAGKLAKGILKINHVKTDNQEHNEIVDMINSYRTINSMNGAFETEAVDHNGRKLVTHDTLVQIAQPYIINSVNENAEKDPLARYAGKNVRAIVAGALMAIVSGSKNSTLATTKMIESDAKKKVEERLSDEESKARVVRESLIANPNFEQAGAFAYELAK